MTFCSWLSWVGPLPFLPQGNLHDVMSNIIPVALQSNGPCIQQVMPLFRSGLGTCNDIDKPSVDVSDCWECFMVREHSLTTLSFHCLVAAVLSKMLESGDFGLVRMGNNCEASYFCDLIRCEKKCVIFFMYCWVGLLTAIFISLLIHISCASSSVTA